MGRQRRTWPLKRKPSITPFILDIIGYLNEEQVNNISKSTCRIEKKIRTIETKIEKMEMDKKIKDDLKTVALGTSKINYLDPRITVAWCKRHEVPIEKVYSLDIAFILLEVRRCTVTEPVPY